MHRLAIIALAAVLAACGKGETQAPKAQVQSGIERSVADVRAAEAATSGPVVQSKNVAELTRPAEAGPEDAAEGPDNRTEKAPAEG